MGVRIVLGARRSIALGAVGFNRIRHRFPISRCISHPEVSDDDRKVDVAQATRAAISALRVEVAASFTVQICASITTPSASSA